MKTGLRFGDYTFHHAAAAQALSVQRHHWGGMRPEMVSFHDLAAALKMDVTELMRQANAKTPPSKTGQGFGAGVENR